MGYTHLNEGGVCFLVKIEFTEEDRKRSISEDHFVDYLKKEGFHNPGFGFWDVPAYYINIDSMVYLPARPGIGYAPPIGDCLITEEDFKVIWNIFKERKKQKAQ